MSNLRLINETTASSVSTVYVTDVFTSDYDIYKIVVSNIEGASTNQWTNMNCLDSSDNAITTTNYGFAMYELKTYGTYSENKSTSAQKWNYLWIEEADKGAGNTMYIFTPTSTSSYTFLLGESSGFYGSSGNVNCQYIGALKELTEVSGFKLTRATGSWTSMTIRTYGLRVDT
tara:strand:+ start:57 stop:575 length:519 start_codon:yes stop_codon:yes gene_type:complete